jgi:hypothetical protein
MRGFDRRRTISFVLKLYPNCDSRWIKSEHCQSAESGMCFRIDFVIVVLAQLTQSFFQCLNKDLMLKYRILRIYF